MRTEPPVHRCFVSLPCSELLNGFFSDTFHILSSLQFVIHEIFGGITDFSPGESQSTLQRSSVSLLYRGMK